MSASRPKSLGERIESELERLFDPIGRWLLTSSLMNYVHLVPSLPGFFRRKFAHPDGPWTVDLPPLAPQLASAPGIRRNRAAEHDVSRLSAGGAARVLARSIGEKLSRRWHLDRG